MWLLLGQMLEKLVYFSLQHLVTLNANHNLPIGTDQITLNCTFGKLQKYVSNKK